MKPVFCLKKRSVLGLLFFNYQYNNKIAKIAKI